MSLRLDDTGFGGIRILQDPETFCYGVDAVLLAGFAAETLAKKHRRPARLADLGCGNGIVPLILSHKTSISHLHGIEVQEQMAALADENVRQNGLEDRLTITCGNVRDAEPESPLMQALGGPGSFDAVTSNPPYMPADRGLTSANEAKAIARTELKGDLDDFLKMAGLLLRDKGDLFLIHRPQRLVDILVGCRKHGIEPKTLVPVSARPGEAPNLILVHGICGGGVELKLEQTFFVRNECGEYSRELLDMYERL